MTFWGYLALLLIAGCMVEDYQHQKHLNELEKIEASTKCAELRSKPE